MQDIYEKILHKGKPLKEAVKLRWSRWVLLFSGILALLMAYLAQDLIFWLVLFAWAGLGASFGPVLILSLYWKKMTRAGVISGMVTGTVVTLIWKIFLKDATGIYELIPAFLFSVLAAVLVSLLSGSGSRRA
ncbi:MAG TPA: hypothetical protein ENO07_08575 [candidate division Zixibacteria bacterium]|nr:hypothetical protein [candidate division Zixibacteria bacterium]